MPAKTRASASLNFEQDLKIDLHRLESEWADQAILYMRYSRASADAKAQVDHVRQQLDVVRAQVDAQIRSNPEKYGLEKTTEAAILAALSLQREVREANERLIAARHEADVVASATRAFEHRRSALENEVRLFLANYYSSPTGDGEQGREFDQQALHRKIRDVANDDEVREDDDEGDAGI